MVVQAVLAHGRAESTAAGAKGTRVVGEASTDWVSVAAVWKECWSGQGLVLTRLSERGWYGCRCNGSHTSMKCAKWQRGRRSTRV
jgi:hypothetical protein